MVSREEIIRDLKKALGEAQKRGDSIHALALSRLLTEALKGEE